MTETTTPLSIFTPFSGRVEIQLFGPPHDWGIKDKDPEILARIGQVAEALGVARINAPKPDQFNARICQASELTEQWRLGKSVACILRGGIEADGVILPYGEAFWLSSADCLVVVACDPISGVVIAAHGGRDSLVDRRCINTNQPARENFSVVGAIIKAFGRGVDVSCLRVFLSCGIGPEDFRHSWSDPKWGEANKRLVTYVIEHFGPQCVVGEPQLGKLNLVELVKAQFNQQGVPSHQIGWDGINTLADPGPFRIADMSDDDPERPYDGCRARWWSNRRGDGAKRNGVMVIRRW